MDTLCYIDFFGIKETLHTILTVLRSYCVTLYPYIAYDCMYFNDSNSKWFSLQPRGSLNTSWPSLFLLYTHLLNNCLGIIPGRCLNVIIRHTHKKCSLLTILRRMTMSPQIDRPLTMLVEVWRRILRRTLVLQ